MKRAHRMPFGAEVIDRGGVRFRLWAPAVESLALRLDAEDEQAMTATGAGWFELRHPRAGAGSRYQFRLPDGLLVPDPASRFNPDDVDACSEVIDPASFDWSDELWCGRPWEEAVIYEVHVGSFSAAGTFSGLAERLEYLAELGVSAIEIMPVADFSGRRNWGYDGVLPFAPDSTYGRPDDFKRLVDAAHQRGLMVLLDVVYNHFGPQGNYLHAYAPDFFNPRHVTPWGASINFDGPNSRTVRDFFIHNALYWLDEFHLDGLRLDAVHAISDDSSPDIVEELAAALRDGPGRERHVHLVLENDRNESHYLSRDAAGQARQASAQWNDDAHHTLHVLASGEVDGHYADYASDPLRMLSRCLSQGFAFQGEPSLLRNGQMRGEPSGHLPPAAFVNFLQNHDQVGNRAFGERLCHLIPPAALEALTSVLLLAPPIPLLFMGEEFAASQPFLFFCDFSAELADAVREGRRHEFAHFARFTDPAALALIPDPNAATTFGACVLDWSALGQDRHRIVLDLYRHLLSLRRRWIIPRLAGMGNGAPQSTVYSATALGVSWRLGDGSRLRLAANLGNSTADFPPLTGVRIFATGNLDDDALACGRLPPWSVAWSLESGARR
ncbi:MAG: malto-oligosyltrehalose trehalohydrolase [Proteobacteria bacterium]|nr:malto-oligosyltrehalose trehalohydrolase [Pseudomonadota bacterium]